MNNRLFNALSFRIAILFSLSTITILITMGLVIHQRVTRHFENEDRMLLEGKIQLIHNLLAQHPSNSVELAVSLNDALIGHDNLIIQVERPIGKVIFSSIPAIISKQQITQSDVNPWIKWNIKDHTYRGFIYKKDITNNNISQSTQTLVGIDTSEHMLFLNEFRRQLFYIGLIGTICLMFLGWFAAWRGLRPVKRMAKVAESISAQHLSVRLELNNTPSELKPLTIAFNDMLDRLEVALEKLSDFSSDLAHEIRTPINNLMTQTQVCLSRSRDIDAYKEVLFSNLEEFEHLARIVSDMLFLAKAENGLTLAKLEHIDLAAEVEALFEFYDALAAEKNIRFEQSGSGKVNADPTMLRRALSNLFSNAIKYGKSNSVIRVKFQQQIENTLFSIENEGPVLSPEQLSRVFDRFYRTDASRQRVEDGTGLGLAITKSILDMHNALIYAESRNGLVIFSIIFKNQ
ncbi:heavy metal sensor histidine kinase [Acinetobacter nematophilus]|uniref:Sensor protein n=1 Tax=Acinetobacter nematophilus TaxID=2994642 RepID=A0A9X3IGK7_9GAMM|nr:heavy metal sensor histidine kinase [Acinetobacter nematophilus]MCX5466359.1 heavy metal sensor histidine kinase [Acinetobacter nematophilus]